MCAKVNNSLKTEEEEHHCNICCVDRTFDEQGNCESCGNHMSLEVEEKDSEISALTQRVDELTLELKEAKDKINIINGPIIRAASELLHKIGNIGSMYERGEDIEARSLILESRTDAEGIAQAIMANFSANVFEDKTNYLVKCPEKEFTATGQELMIIAINEHKEDLDVNDNSFDNFPPNYPKCINNTDEALWYLDTWFKESYLSITKVA